MSDAVRRITQAFDSLWRSFLDRIPSLATGLVVFLLFWLAAGLIRRAIHGVALRTRLQANLALLLSRIGSFAAILFGALVAAVIVFPAFRIGDLVAGLGLTSVAIGFAFKDIFQNFFAGILILWRQPFRVGDEIRSGEFEGKVEDITTRSTRLRTYDGELAVLPNGDVYTRAILVRTANKMRRGSVVVGIGYGDQIDEAREAIYAMLETTEGVLQDPGPWVYVSELAASSINLTVYFWVEPPQANLLQVSDRVATGIKSALDCAGIDMPYPHQVVMLQPVAESTSG